MSLQLIDTSDDPPIKPAKEVLEIYWRQQYDRLREDTCAQTIRSLRSELTTIKRLCVDGGDAEEVLRSVLFHARLALEVSQKETQR